MKYSNKPLAQSLVAYCKAYNIRHVVISPGSRNAPLTIGFSYHEDFSCYSIVDERCAGFFALGIAQQLQEPVVLVCTSGSALLNYYPAISEAYFSHIPLVVMSADRPEHLVGIGDGQTIFQKDVFGRHVSFSANLRSDETTENTEINHQLINKALSVASSESTPVHLNVPFDEPLYKTTDAPLISSFIRKAHTMNEELPKEQIERFKKVWYGSKRKMILIGVLEPNAIDEELLELLSKDQSLIVFSETTSNIKHAHFFPSIDKIIAPLSDEDFVALQPEVLLTFGGMVISKKVKAFLRNYAPREHWHIGPYEANDTFFCLKEHVKALPNIFLSKVLDSSLLDDSNEYRIIWDVIKHRRAARHLEYLKTIPFSDFTVFQMIQKHVPRATSLQLGNSSTIRYAQLFDWPKETRMFCNRGTSGIDGSTSTAIGAALVSDLPTLHITGDLSFFYDSNALWNNYIPSNFKIVIINNGGGGIFRILPGHKNTINFDTYFETKHNLTAEQLCQMYGLTYITAKNKNELVDGLSSLFQNNERPALLEVFTPSNLNDEILLGYFDYIR